MDSQKEIIKADKSKKIEPIYLILKKYYLQKFILKPRVTSCDLV